MNGKIDNNRLTWIDWAKTLGIFFICIGHFLPSGNVLRIFLYTFHVPLFFVVSIVVLLLPACIHMDTVS